MCFKGGRGVVVGPILNQGRSDVFCDNENGPNFLFKNKGDGTFEEVARRAGETISDGKFGFRSSCVKKHQ